VANGHTPASAAPQWTAEVDVSPEFAAGLIREQFPDVGTQQVTVLATGWDNIAFQVDRRWLFRFPRRAVAVPGVQREITVLPRLAASLPLPIPDPRFIGQPSARYPWPFFGTRLLPGRELADSGLPDSRRAGVAASVGHFLRVLHDPGHVITAGAADLPVDPMQRASPPVRALRAREVLDRLVHRRIWPGDSDVSALLDQAERAAAGPGPAPGPAGRDAGAAQPGRTVPGGDQLSGPVVVCHGDLHVRHLLVDRDGSATGIIDWGDLCLADPAVDLSIAYFGFAGRARADLLSAFGRRVGAARELAARTAAVSLAASLAEYAAEDGRAALLRESLAGLRRAVTA
jgi:aminoglycoside phosphotransferase (APT) family kinase protein